MHAPKCAGDSYNNQMRKDYEKLFSNLKAPKPSSGLFAKIMQRIDREEQLLKIKYRFVAFSALFLASIAVLFPSLKMAVDDFSQTGFTTFLSLLLSDANIILTHSGNFIFALLESLPVFSIMAVLAALFLSLQSLKFLARNIKFIY